MLPKILCVRCVRKIMRMQSMLFGDVFQSRRCDGKGSNLDLSMCLDCAFVCPRFFFLRFPFFFFQAAVVDKVFREQCFRALFTNPQITLFSNFFFKNGSHNTIYTFKNYFAIVFSVSVFSFSKNKLNLNGPIVSEAFPFIHKTTLLFYSKYYYINIYIYIYMQS